jgi:hypothetical protein
MARSSFEVVEFSLPISISKNLADIWFLVMISANRILLTERYADNQKNNGPTNKFKAK